MSRALTLFFLAAIPRAAYLYFFAPETDSAYWGLSESLLRYGSFAFGGVADTDFEPLYPAFLAVSRVAARDWPIGVQLIQIAAASSAVVALDRLAHRLSGAQTVATVTACLYAFSPLLIKQAAAASDLALCTTLLIFFAHAFVSMRDGAGALRAGLWLGLTVLTRSMVLPVAVCGAAILAMERRRRELAIFAATFLVVLLPWLIRNVQTNGAVLPTRSGLNFYIGNSPFTDALLPDHDLDLLQSPASALVARARPDLDENAPEDRAAIDAFYIREGLAYMRSRPLATLRRKVMNAAYFISPRVVPFYIAGPETSVAIAADGAVEVRNPLLRPRMEIVAHAAASSIVVTAAFVGVYLRRRYVFRDFILWSIVFTFIAAAVLYFPATRYRAPMEFVLYFYAALALTSLRGPLTRGRRSPPVSAAGADPDLSGRTAP